MIKTIYDCNAEPTPFGGHSDLHIIGEANKQIEQDCADLTILVTNSKSIDIAPGPEVGGMKVRDSDGVTFNAPNGTLTVKGTVSISDCRGVVFPETLVVGDEFALNNVHNSILPKRLSCEKLRVNNSNIKIPGTWHYNMLEYTPTKLFVQKVKETLESVKDTLEKSWGRIENASIQKDEPIKLPID